MNSVHRAFFLKATPATVMNQRSREETVPFISFWRQTAVRWRPPWGRQACKWASLERFLTACVEILWLCKAIVAAAVWGAGLRPSLRQTCRMWRSWAGTVTCGLSLDVLPNSLNRLWKRLREMNIQFTGDSSGGQPCSQRVKFTLHQNLQHLWHRAVWSKYPKPHQKHSISQILVKIRSD